MTRIELRTLALLAARSDHWFAPRNMAESIACKQLFRRGFADQRVATPGNRPKFEYQALPRPVEEARKLGLIPGNP
jgi:hypothetical protein